MTIPTLALTAFVLLIELLASLLSASDEAGYGESRCLAERRASSGGARPAPPPVRVEGRARQRQASPRVLIGAGVAALAIAIGVVLAVVLGGGSSDSLANVPAVGSLGNALPGAADVHSLLEGIPQSGNDARPPSAPVTLRRVHRPPVPLLPAVRDPGHARP